MKHRRILIAAAALVGVTAAAAIGFGVAVHQLKRSLEQSLGPRASVGTVQVGWTGVEALDVRVRAERARDGWPSQDELRARRVRLQPALASLWRPGWHIQRVTIEDAYVSALRTRDGHLRIFPSLLDETPPAAATGRDTHAPLIRLGTLQLANATIDVKFVLDGNLDDPNFSLNENLATRVASGLAETLGVSLGGVVQGVGNVIKGIFGR